MRLLSPARLRPVALTGITAALLASACMAADDQDVVPESLPSAADTTAARPDSLFADGDAVRMPDAEVRRLVANDPLWAEALRIHYDALVVDGHIDTPSLMLDRGYMLGLRHDADHVDLPRMVEGGLDAAFFSIYVSRAYSERAEAPQRARDMIAEVERQVSRLPGAEIARTGADVRRIAGERRKAILLGLEGGHALRGRVDLLEELAERGVRYVTLTHTNTNSFADASTDAPRWGGLNDTGRDLVRAMNRLGVIVDLSHVSDSTFYDALAVTAAPVLLSHSSCGALYAHPRNVSDDMLRALAANGGAILINFYATYLGGGRVDVDTVLDHIDHAVEVAGIDHVGLGSDFDGVDRLPDGMDDATRLPWITYGLLRRGYSETDVRKILGLNALRVLDEVGRLGRQGG